MKALFVGQRVRILRSICWPELAGSEARVLGFIVAGINDHPACEVEVAPDAWGSNVAPYPGRGGYSHFAPAASQLEPILPEGSAPSEYSFSELMDSLRETVK